MSDNQLAQPNEAAIAAWAKERRALYELLVSDDFASFEEEQAAAILYDDMAELIANEGEHLLQALADWRTRALAAEAALKQARDDAFDIGQIADSPDWLGFHESPPTDVIRDLGNRGYAIYEALCKVVPEAASADEPTGGE